MSSEYVRWTANKGSDTNPRVNRGSSNVSIAITPEPKRGEISFPVPRFSLSRLKTPESYPVDLFEDCFLSGGENGRFLADKGENERFLCW